MRIKAKFIGEDSSLGYRNSRVYRLVKAKTPNGHIVISKVDGLGYCPYTSEKTFKENWELIDKD